LRAAVASLATAAGGQILEDAGLEAIVLHLVEYPGAVAGAFPGEFLELPSEVLTTTLRHHQRCFSVAGADGALLPRFVAAVNAPTDPDGAIQRGYERVIAGRLADARFFYKEDRKRPLAARCAPDVVRPGDVLLFHEGLDWTLEALPAVIEGLLGAGYELVTMADLVAT
jgi:glycyl-tRNA synthetase beta chain